MHLIGGRKKQFENINGVVQIPYLPVNDFIKQVRGAEFCILPLEPVPFSFGQMRLLQQMALRKCVIVSDAPSIMDYVEDGKTALVYRSADIEDLCNRITTLNADDEEREKIETNAFEFVKQICNERKMAEEIELFFVSI